jgi:serine/threonine protein kinase/tetratricopeptide (TPR) repeat protein
VSAPPSPTDDCLDDDTLLEVVQGRGQAVLSRTRDHLDRCGPCRALVAELAQLADETTLAPTASGPHGRFERRRRLGAATWRAVHPRTQTAVVLRALPLERRAVQDRLRGLRGAGLCPIVELADDPQGILLARDWLPGMSFDALLRDEPPGTRELARLLAELTRTVQHLHAAGLAHGHLVPENVIVDVGGELAVTDAGTVPCPSREDDLQRLAALARLAASSSSRSASERLRRAADEVERASPDGLSRLFDALRSLAGVSSRGRDGPPPASEGLSGQLLGGRFELGPLQARGGMGAVHRGVDRASGAAVAIKLMLPTAHGPERFAREAKALMELDHPNVARYVAHGEHGGRLYLVMRWVDGEPLSDRLRRGALPMAVAVELVRQAANGLAAAHARGIVHRDLKPQNLMLASEDPLSVLVVDFGLSRQSGVDATLTVDGAVLGTPGFMAPEQARGERDIDARADVFAFGCILYRCLSGRRPFEGDDVAAVLAKTALSPPPSLAELCPEVPPPLAEIVSRAMARERAQRFADAAELARALAELPELCDASATVVAPALAGDEGESATVLLLAAPAPHARVRAAAKRWDGRYAALAGGEAAVIWRGSGSGIDERLARAADCALALGRAAPSAVLALGTGLMDRSASGGPAGEVLERLSGLLTREPEPGAILLDDATFGLLSGRYGVSERGERRLLEGRLASPTPRLVLGRTTPFVGRGVELATIAALVDDAVSSARARLLFLTGAAGMGKSRLVYEALAQLARGHPSLRAFSALAEISHEGSPFALAAALLRAIIGADETDEVAEQRQELRAELARLDLDSSAVRVPLETVLGIAEMTPSARSGLGPDATLQNDRIQTAWQAFFRASTALGPVVLAVDDLHWADYSSLRLIGRLLRVLEAAPLAVLAVGRNDLDARFPGLWAVQNATRIRLGPLRARETGRLAQSIFAHDPDDPRVRAALEAAEGNPFHLEELARAASVGATGPPGSVLALARARIDLLGSGARRALQATAVFGRRAWFEGLRALTGADGDELELWLGELVHRELLDRAPGAPGLGAELEFRHALLRDAAYSMLTHEERTASHRRAAEWLSARGVQEPAVVAEHFEKGGDARQAARLSLLAAERALAGNDMRAVLTLAERARAHATPAEEHRLLMFIAEAESCLGHHAAAAEAARRALAGAPVGSAAWLDAAVPLAEALQTLGDRQELSALAESLAMVDVDPAELGTHAVACARVVIDLRRSNELSALDALLGAVRAHGGAVHEHDVRSRAFLHRHHAIESFVAGEWDQELTHLRESVRLFDAAGDARWAARQRFNLGYFLTLFGLAADGEAELLVALNVVQRLGLTELQHMMKQNLGFARFRLGRFAEAEECYTESLTAVGTTGAQRKQGISRLYLARLAIERGNAELAEEEARRALECFARGSPQLAPYARAVAARASMESGRERQALEEAGAAYAALSPQMGLAEGEFYVRATAAELLERAGAVREAWGVAEQAKSRLLELSARIRAPDLRESFLEQVPEHARILELQRSLAAAAKQS